MAEGGSVSGIGNEHSLNDTDEETVCSSEQVVEGSSIPECAVCLQTCVHPAQLPCGHIFCFLCVKGVANQSKKCAMCRQEIPSDYLEKPQLVEPYLTERENSVFDDGYQWFYEGRNGWWQYDERTSRELESSYKRGERLCELLIAGFLYVADFDAMLQLRRNDPSRRRRIKRDHATIPKKGVAGLRLDNTQAHEEPLEDNHRSKSPTLSTTPVPPTNTPQTPAGSMASGDTTPERRESLDQALMQIRTLNLHNDYSTESDSSEDELGSGDENQDLPDLCGLLTSTTTWRIPFSSDEDQL